MTTKPFWLIILMIIPIVVFEMLKAIILAAIYFSNPIVYFALMMAQSFGLSLEDYLNKEKKKALKKIEEGLTPGSPEHTAVKKQIEELEKEEEQDSSIIELKCQIPPKNTN
jgi:choline-glycine betaine transporter